MEGDTKLICKVLHTNVRCTICGSLVWTQVPKNRKKQGYTCNECAGVRAGIPVDLLGHWKDTQSLMEKEV